ncbi:MAG: divalent-cation tolerance protein CutA [Chlamydiia bacterium]
MFVILWTAAQEQEALTIIRALVEQHLIACGTVLPGARSIYCWQGKIEESQEVQCILKTEEGHQERVLETIRKMGSYSNPEFLCLPVEWASPEYAQWVNEHLEERRPSLNLPIQKRSCCSGHHHQTPCGSN